MLFETLDDARRFFLDNTSTDMAEALLSLMTPFLALEPLDPATVAPGHLSYLGGMPVMAVELGWPTPAMPEDIDTIASMGGRNHGVWIRKNLEARLPHSFIGQIDLAALPVKDTALPDHGRLLFFYDIAVGPWDNGTRAARVIWDQGPAADGVTHPVPDVLDQAEEEYLDEVRSTDFTPPTLDADAIAFLRELDPAFDAEALRQAQKEVGVSVEIDHYYLAPKQPFRLRQYWQVPRTQTIEWEGFIAKLAPMVPKVIEENEDDLSLLVSDIIDAYDGGDYEAAYTSYLLGLPEGEQDDPRYAAAIVRRYDSQFMPPDHTKAEWETIKAEATQWHLLFQISLTQWWNDPHTEGTVYYLIYKDDLTARRFDKVMAVYQQT